MLTDERTPDNIQQDRIKVEYKMRVCFIRSPAHPVATSRLTTDLGNAARMHGSSLERKQANACCLPLCATSSEAKMKAHLCEVRLTIVNRICGVSQL
jgi:hypothetical protein